MLARHNQQQGLAAKGSGDAQTALLLAVIGGEQGVVYDPAAGLGGFLMALGRAVGAEQRPRLFGQEMNEATSRIARQRFLVHEIPVSLGSGDTLIDDRWPELQADVVVCDPPYQMKKSWPASANRDPRWAPGPPPTVTDFAWLQHAVYHLTENGRAYVFLPPGSLFRGGREKDLRRELLAKGAVEAVVSLPPRTALQAGIPLVLWILRRPGTSSERDSVLLVDATAAGPTNRAAFAEIVPRVAAVLQGWQEGEELSEQDRELAASVPISELVQGSATMVPARWIHRELTETQREEQEDDFEKTLAGMGEICRALGSKVEIARPPARSAAEWVPVKRLVEDGLVEIIKGTRVKPEDCLSSGVPVLRTRDIAAKFGEPVEPCYIAIDAALTKPGDIVLSPASGSLRAFVDRNGGHVVARPLQALRLLDDFMDPEVVAAFLESPRNRRFVTGAAYARVSLRDLELPTLAARDSETLRVALEGLGHQERLAGELASSAQRLRHTLVSLASPSAGEGS
ncbi:MAG TPA: N-6 DNA methylase [Solirubrobacterales bacterium]